MATVVILQTLLAAGTHETPAALTVQGGNKFARFTGNIAAADLVNPLKTWDFRLLESVDDGNVWTVAVASLGDRGVVGRTIQPVVQLNDVNMVGRRLKAQLVLSAATLIGGTLEVA